MLKPENVRFLRGNSIRPAEMSGLEIGPHNQPMVSKDEGDILYMDFMSRDEHIKSAPNVPYIEEIPETDIIIKDNNYISYIGDRRFDYIIANHVGEHAPDFIGFLNMLSSMLNANGIVFLALPDKKFTFDKFRQNTTLSHVVSDYLCGPQTSIKEHMLEDLLFYDRSFVGAPQDLESRLSKHAIERKLNTVPHYGLHCHVFQSETIVDSLLVPLTHTGFIDLDVLEFYEARPERGGEMILLLVKREATHFLQPEKFLVNQFSLKDDQCNATEPVEQVAYANAKTLSVASAKAILNKIYSKFFGDRNCA
ncbi:methyltransferase domain-containing protein [Brucella anthropi]|uniref:Class I SAM-dependent methyltransferase n=1 Tax=Brucella anthropi TaxID=529 RepID=A0A6L3ZAS6_BRUAN|nr:methyltransferase domain-containing protein [Brucella anthropi]KAB2772448.1 class I SAM-dependent methyltransferase [Brucella anthropi]UVV69925.1 class I SAM-dependent methyltransferase [Brucella anthropi]